MNFKEEYKAAMNEITPDEQAMRRIRGAVMDRVSGKTDDTASESGKFRRKKPIYIYAAACVAAVLVGASLLRNPGNHAADFAAGGAEYNAAADQETADNAAAGGNTMNIGADPGDKSVGAGHASGGDFPFTDWLGAGNKTEGFIAAPDNAGTIEESDGANYAPAEPSAEQSQNADPVKSDASKPMAAASAEQTQKNRRIVIPEEYNGDILQVIETDGTELFYVKTEYEDMPIMDSERYTVETCDGRTAEAVFFNGKIFVTDTATGEYEVYEPAE